MGKIPGLAEVLSDDNIKSALQHLENKHDSCGLDGIRLSELTGYWKINGANICNAICKGEYQPGIVLMDEVVQTGGKRRMIGKLNSVDRMITRAIYQVLSPHVEHLFSAKCYSYVKDRGIEDAVKSAALYIEQGKSWVCEIDVKDFFGSISHDMLSLCLMEIGLDKNFFDLIMRYVKCDAIINEERKIIKKGLVQGSSLSPLLSNIFMMTLDQKMEKAGLAFCRFGDDINIYCNEPEEAHKIRNTVTEWLSGMGLTVNKKKGGVYKAVNRRYLGYDFFEKDSQIFVHRTTRKSGCMYNHWQRTAIQKVNKTYHLINDGILTKKDFNILFENEEGKNYLPAEVIDAINIYSSVIFSSKFFQFAADKRLIISLFDQSGDKVGTFIPENTRRDYKTELSQMQLRMDEKQNLAVAKKYQNANIFNLRAILRYYARRDSGEQYNESIEKMTKLIQKVNEAKDIKALMMCEAQARQKYYQCFNLILKNEEFHYTCRSRRPPKDPLNAMISFGNTLLYQFFANLIYQSSLDIRFGMLHNSYHRQESLNLDLADLFKPVLVDRTIFTLVNRNMITVETDFETVENGGIYLTNHGRRTFIREFETKMSQRLKVKGETKTYDGLMREEVKKMEKFFRKGETYKPYKYVN